MTVAYQSLSGEICESSRRILPERKYGAAGRGMPSSSGGRCLCRCGSSSNVPVGASVLYFLASSTSTNHFSFLSLRHHNHFLSFHRSSPFDLDYHPHRSPTAPLESIEPVCPVAQAEPSCNRNPVPLHRPRKSQVAADCLCIVTTRRLPPFPKICKYYRCRGNLVETIPGSPMVDSCRPRTQRFMFIQDNQW